MLLVVSLQLYPVKFFLDLISSFISLPSFCGLWLVGRQVSRNIELLKVPFTFTNIFNYANRRHHW